MMAVLRQKKTYSINACTVVTLTFCNDLKYLMHLSMKYNANGAVTHFHVYKIHEMAGFQKR